MKDPRRNIYRSARARFRNLPFYDRNVVVNGLVYICTSYKMRGRAGMNGSVQKRSKKSKAETEDVSCRILTRRESDKKAVII